MKRVGEIIRARVSSIYKTKITTWTKPCKSYLQSLNVRDSENEITSVATGNRVSSWLCLLFNPLPHHVLLFLRGREGGREGGRNREGKSIIEQLHDMHACLQAHMHARAHTHARTHARTHACTHTTAMAMSGEYLTKDCSSILRSTLQPSRLRD